MKVWIKAILISLIVIAVIKISIYAATGIWQMGFAIQSESMKPNMQKGDLILIQSSQHTNIITYEDGKILDYRSFNDYGNLIAYYPYGNFNTIPIIHRAVYYVEAGEPIWVDGPAAPHAGYITKGDNPWTNPSFDQQGSISYNQPVKKEWVIGVARARIPYIGYFLSGMGGTVLMYSVIYAVIAGFLLRREKL